MFSTGCATGWSSPTIPKLLAGNHVSEDEGSWIVSIMIFGFLFGPIPMKLLVDRCGRKFTMLASAVPVLFGWILICIGLPGSVWLLYIARLFHGIGTGMAYCACAIYLGEIASDSIRGSLGALICVMTSAGILMAYSIGPYVSVTVFPYILMVPPVLFIGTFIWLPESAYYLIAKKNEEAAAKSLKLLRGQDNIEEELKQIKIAVEKANENEGTFKELFTKGNKKTIIIAIGLITGQQLCGSDAILGYSETIFHEIGGDLGASEAAIIMGVVQLLVTIVSSSIVDGLGRRPLLLGSTLGAAISLLIVGIFFFIKQSVDVSSVSWISVTSIMLFNITFNIGIGTVPFTMLGEIFASNVKALAAGVCLMVAAVVGSVITKLFEVVNSSIGIQYTFVGLGIFALLATIFIYFMVPETKQKSLDVILEELNSSWRSKKQNENKSNNIEL